MPELISKLTSMVTSTTESFLTLVTVIAVLALIVWALMGFTSGDEHRKLAAGKGILGVILFVVVAACATGLVSWAMAS